MNRFFISYKSLKRDLKKPGFELSYPKRSRRIRSSLSFSSKIYSGKWLGVTYPALVKRCNVYYTPKARMDFDANWFYLLPCIYAFLEHSVQRKTEILNMRWKKKKWNHHSEWIESHISLTWARTATASHRLGGKWYPAAVKCSYDSNRWLNIDQELLFTIPD